MTPITNKFIDTFFGDRFVESYVDTASVNKKLDTVKKPLQIVTAVGIALAVITFFVLIYLILRLLFGFGLALVSSAYKNSNHAVSENQAGLFYGPQIKVSNSTVHIKKGHTEPVYANLAPHN
jgi:beta-lactamase regulating signal transducer with metallopeptidase domain